MPTFEIPDGPTTVELTRSGDAKTPGPATGSIVFNVTNTSNDSCDGRLSVVPSGNSKEEWFTIEGDRERAFASGETQTATIKISAPKEVTAGDYPFRLRAVSVADPDNDHAEGPVATAKVPPPAVIVNKGIPWWVWLLIGLVVLAAVGAGLYFALRDGDEEEAPPTNNVVTAPESKVPKFVDQNVDNIPANASGYQIIKNETANTNRPPRIVYEQDPKPDTALPAGQRVIVSYEPGVVVPELPGGATFASAPNALRAAGLQPGNFLCDRNLSGTPNAPVGNVTRFEPASGARVAANSQVHMYAVQATRCVRLILSPEVFRRINRESVVARPKLIGVVRDHRQ